MSSKLQLDVCDHSQWWRHLLNPYEVETRTVLFAGKTVWSTPEGLRGFTTRRCINTFTFTDNRWMALQVLHGIFWAIFVPKFNGITPETLPI